MPTKKIAKFKPDPRDSSPLYLQLSRSLGDAIRDGLFRAQEALPSERTLSESSGVSRVTARKAIDQLVDQGMIVRRRGSGNYIAPRIETPLSRLTSFSEELARRGHTPKSRWLQRALTVGSVEERASLGLPANSKVARLERLRLADDVVMAFEVSVLPQAILPQPELVKHSLYEYLAAIGKAPVRAVQHIRALNADAVLAAKLGIPVGMAVLVLNRIGYLDSGAAIELTLSYCRSDYYDFVAEMRRL
ncbi:MAG: GntR family transcriptional regulator [Betaproteobacteria bacterium]|nr:GntR family transcriptional regulator [Betaproteobacteria bacterium]